MPNVTVVEVGTPDDVTLEVTASPPPGIEVEAPPTSPVIEVQQVRGPPGPPGAGSTDGVAVLADPNVFTKHQAIGNLATAADYVPVVFGGYAQPTVLGVFEQYTGPMSAGYVEGTAVYVSHEDTTAPTSGTQGSLYTLDITAQTEAASTIHYADIFGIYTSAIHRGSGRAERTTSLWASSYVQVGSGGSTETIGVRADVITSDGVSTDTAIGLETSVYTSAGKSIGVHVLQSQGTTESHGVVIEPTTGTAPIKRGIWQKGTSDVNVLQGVLSPLVSTDVGVRVRGLVGQSGDLQRWEASDSSLRANIDANGSVYFAGSIRNGASGIFANTTYGIGAGQVAAQVGIVPNGPSQVGFGIKGYAGQTGDLTQWMNSGGSALAYITADGDFTAQSLNAVYDVAGRDGSFSRDINLSRTDTSPAISAGTGLRFITDSTFGRAYFFDNRINVTSKDAGLVASVIKGASGQSGDLTQWQNSGGGALSYVKADGGFVFGTNTSNATSVDDNGVISTRGFYSKVPGGGLSNYVANSFDSTGLYFGSGSATQDTKFVRESAGKVAVQGFGAATATQFTVRAVAGQGTNLQEWQNSSGGALASVSSGGIVSGVTFQAGSQMRSNYEVVAGDITGGGVLGALTAYAWGASVIPFVARGYSGQTADLQQWQANDGTVLAKVTKDGYIYEGANRVYSASNPPPGGGGGGDVYLASNQTFTGANTFTASIGASGGMYVGNDPVVNGWLGVGIKAATNMGIVVRGYTAQTASLQEWQDSSTATLASISASGTLFMGGDTVAITPAVNGYSGMRAFLQTAQAGVIGLAIRAASSQSADLTQWQNNSGSAIAWVDATGAAQFTALVLTNGSNGQLYLAGAKIVGYTNGDVFYDYATGLGGSHQWFGGGTSTVASISSAGLIYGRQGSFQPATDVVPLTVRTVASQTAHIMDVYGHESASVGWHLVRDSNDVRQKFLSTSDGQPYVELATVGSYFKAPAIGITPLAVHGYSSGQTADLQTWSIAGSLVAKVTATGSVVASGQDSQFKNQLTINNTSGQAALAFAVGGAAQWYLYESGAGSLYLRDIVNSRMLATFNPGATAAASSVQLSGAVTVDSVLTVAGTVSSHTVGGYVVLNPADSSHSGYVEFASPGNVRQGYIGYSATSAAVDSGTIPYVAGTHAFTGAITTTGSITENGTRVYSANNAPPYPVTTVAGRTGAVVIAPSDVSGVYYSGNANLASATPAAVASAGAVGAGTDYARGNHVHAGVSSLVASTFIAVSAATGAVTPSLSATGTPGSTTFLRGDNTWAVPTGAVTSVATRTGAVTLTAADIAAGTFPAGSYAFANNSTITIDSASTAGGMVMGDGGTAALGPEIKLLNNGNNHWSFRNASGVLQIGTTSGGAGLGLTLASLLTLTPATGAVNAPTQLQEAGNRVYSAGNAPPYPVTTVAGRTGAVVIAPADVSGVYYSGNANLASATPAAVASAGAVGAGTDYARGNHVHAGVASITTNTGLSSNVSATGAVTVTNTGVTSLVASTFIAVSAATGAVTPSLSATGTPSSANFLRGDNTWAAAPVTSVATRTGAVALTAADVGAGTFPGAVTFSGAVTGGAGGYLDLGPVAGSLATLATTSAVGDKISLYDGGVGLGYGFGVQASKLVAYIPSVAAFVVRVAAASGQASSGTEIFTVSGAGVLNTAGNITENGTRLYSVNNKVPIAGLSATGITDSTTFLRGDNTWAVPPTAAVTSVNTRTGAVTGLAEDSSVVHLAGTESITGAKTFTANATVSKTTPSIILTDGTTTHTIGIATSAAQIDTNSLAGDLVIGLQGSTKRIYLSNPVSSISDFNTAGAMNALGGLNDNGNRVYSATRVATMTAKGSQLVATAANTPGELPIGAEGQVQVARAAATTGIAWEDRSFAATGLGSTGNTTTETVIASFTIPAAYLLAGTVLDLKMLGQAGSTQTLTFKIRCGTAGTTADALLQTFTTTVAGVANQHAVVDALVHCLTAGTSGTAYAGGVVLYQGTTNSVYGPVTAAAVTATVNTTVQNKITVTVTNGSNTAFTSRTAILTRVA